MAQSAGVVHGGGNLPAEVTSFVGRRRELADAKRALSKSRLVTLTGVGGVGKTRVAERVARDRRRGYPHGVWLVELGELPDPALLTQTILTELGVRGQPSGDAVGGRAVSTFVAGAERRRVNLLQHRVVDVPGEGGLNSVHVETQAIGG